MKPFVFGPQALLNLRSSDSSGAFLLRISATTALSSSAVLSLFALSSSAILDALLLLTEVGKSWHTLLLAPAHQHTSSASGSARQLPAGGRRIPF